MIVESDAMHRIANSLWIDIEPHPLIRPSVCLVHTELLIQRNDAETLSDCASLFLFFFFFFLASPIEQSVTACVLGECPGSGPVLSPVHHQSD